MADIVPLTTRPQAINARAVELLRDYLGMAERGEIGAVAIAALCSDGASLTLASETDNYQALVGAIAILQYRVIAGHERD